jgi:hypothetical protein
MTVEENRVARPAWLGLRVLLTLHALLVFAQPVLAGRFMAGDYRMLSVHQTNSTVIGILGYVQVIVAFLYWRPAGGVVWPAMASLGISAAETVQILLGYARSIAIHVPLGVLVVLVNVLMVIWAWRPGFGQRRTVSHGSTA